MNTKKLKNKILKHKTLISNFNYLSLLQLFQLLFPLIIYPYLIRILGKELYGMVAYANALAAYFIVFINFGFEISEIREISIHRENKNKVSEIVSSVLIIKTLLAFISIIFLIATIILIPKLNEHKLLYFATFGILFDAAINPRFYFQGIEKMKFITILTLGSRLIFLFLIFIFVREPDDYILVPLLTSIGAVVSSLSGLIVLKAKFKVEFIKPKLVVLYETVKNSLPFFSSRISVLAINKTNVLLIGTFIGYSEVAYYDLAEKLVQLMKMPFNILNQVLFPNVSKNSNIQLVKKIMMALLIVYVIGYMSLFYLAEPLIDRFAGSEMRTSKYVLYILGFSALTELISVFMGAPMLLAMGYKKEYNSSIIWGSIFYLIGIAILYFSCIMNLYTLATTTVLSSTFILVYRLFYCKKYKLL